MKAYSRNGEKMLTLSFLLLKQKYLLEEKKHLFLEKKKTDI